MRHNLFISYDLNSPGQKYDLVANKIKALGSWAKVQKSYWYLNTTCTAEKVAKAVWAVMDSNDSLIVVDTASNDAYWFNLAPETSQFIQRHWAEKSHAA